MGKAAVGQTKSAGQAPPKAMQPAVGGASSSPPAAVRQAPGAAASAAAALGPSATDHKDWRKLTLEAARKSKIASEEALSTAIKAATAAKKAAIAAAKRKYTGVGCRAMSCCRALQGHVLLEHAETRSCVKQWHRRTSLSVQTLLAQPVPAHNIMSQPWPGTLHIAQAALWLNCCIGRLGHFWQPRISKGLTLHNSVHLARARFLCRGPRWTSVLPAMQPRPPLWPRST